MGHTVSIAIPTYFYSRSPVRLDILTTNSFSQAMENSLI